MKRLQALALISSLSLFWGFTIFVLTRMVAEQCIWVLDLLGIQRALWNRGLLIGHDDFYRLQKIALPLAIGVGVFVFVIQYRKTQAPHLRNFTTPILLLGSVFFVWRYLRLFALPFFLATAVLYTLRSRGRPIARSLLVGTGILWVMLSVSPIDVTLINFPGPPRFVPVNSGIPSNLSGEAEARGEIYSMPCAGWRTPARVWVW